MRNDWFRKKKRDRRLVRNMANGKWEGIRERIMRKAELLAARRAKFKGQERVKAEARKIRNRAPGDAEAEKQKKLMRIERMTVFRSVETFTKALEKRGFVKIGGGAFGSVFEHPTKGKGRVLKILRTPESDGWLDYIKWAAQEGQMGKYAPRVYSYKWIKIGEKPRRPWMMEFLGFGCDCTMCARAKRRGQKTPHEGAEPEYGIGLAVMEKLETTVAKIKLEDDRAIINGLWQYAYQYKNKLAKSIVETKQPGLVEFGEKLLDKFERLDDHGGNFMFRADGTFVVTDPVASRNVADYKSRWRVGGTPPALLLRILIESCYRHRGKFPRQTDHDLVYCL